jgi:hypothetical protein
MEEMKKHDIIVHVVFGGLITEVLRRLGPVVSGMYVGHPTSTGALTHIWFSDLSVLVLGACLAVYVGAAWYQYLRVISPLERDSERGVIWTFVLLASAAIGELVVLYMPRYFLIGAAIASLGYVAKSQSASRTFAEPWKSRAVVWRNCGIGVMILSPAMQIMGWKVIDVLIRDSPATWRAVPDLGSDGITWLLVVVALLVYILVMAFRSIGKDRAVLP